MSRERRTVSDDVIVESYKVTNSSVKTAEALGLGQATVMRALTRQGIKTTGLSRYRSSMGSKWEGNQYPGVYTGSKTKVIEWYKSGLSMREIAKRIDRSTHVVMNIIKKAGISRAYQGKGAEHSQWVGGRIADGQGYWRQKIEADDPMVSMANPNGYVKEHRLVMARKLGRPLRAMEVVHHIDGNRQNNDPANLQLLHESKHVKGTAMVCLDCGSHNIGHRTLS